MKRLSLFLLAILVVFVIYSDLNTGTLSFVSVTKEEPITIKQEPQSEEFFEKRVNHGDTVLGVIEASLNGAIPVSIEQVVTDFEKLNNGIRPEQIQYGKTYKFPNYLQEQSTP